MTVTASLLSLFGVDQQLRGLRTRLDAAERFLKAQTDQLKGLETHHGAMELQVRHAKAAIGSDESETATIDARMAMLREQMNAARTNKEYSAFLTELNTLKSQKEAIEQRELDQMEKLQALEKQFADLAVQHDERAKVAKQAKSDRDAREGEISGRLTELAAQRATLAAKVPKEALKILEDLIRLRGDEAMAQVEVLDRRAHEYTCGSCQMTLPVETLNHIVKGTLVRCANCQCILYSAEVLDLHKKPAPKGKKAKQAEQASEI